MTRLLDANRDAREVIEMVLDADRARALGPLKRVDGKQVRQDDLKITVTYWGGGKGRWKPRPFMAGELPVSDYDTAWGERTGDLYLDDYAHFANVPELVWTGTPMQWSLHRDGGFSRADPAKGRYGQLDVNH